MENALMEALARESGPRIKADKKKYAVVQKEYAREKIIFETTSLEDAERVASQHAARRVTVCG